MSGNARIGGEFPRHTPLELGALAAGAETLVPGSMRMRTARTETAPLRQHIGGQLEGRQIPAQDGARRSYFIGAERSAMHIMAALLVGRALADDRAAGDERG